MYSALIKIIKKCFIILSGLVSEKNIVLHDEKKLSNVNIEDDFTTKYNNGVL